MTLLVLGVTHHTAPMAVLDDLALTASDADRLAADAVQSPAVAEAMVLATCNRLELVADVERFHASADHLADILAKAVGSTRDALVPHLHVHYGQRAARHVFDVAAGLDSLVVGEQQIIGQVRAALRAGQDGGTAGPRLNAVGQAALRAAKRVHTETGIDRRGASVVSVALRAAAEGDLPPWPRVRALVVGAGAMSSLAVATLADLGVGSLTITNRTPERAERLAALHGGRTVGLAALPQALAASDIIVTCTGSIDLVLPLALVAEARARVADPLTVVDLALPHDTDPDLSSLPGVRRIGLADLGDRPESQASAEDVAAARMIVDDALAAYLAAEAARRVDPLVVSLRARASAVVDDEARRLRGRLPGMADTQWREVEAALRRTAAALLHTPTVRVKELAADPEGQRYADALHSLFDLPVAVVDLVGGDVEVDPAVDWRRSRRAAAGDGGPA